MTEPAVLVVGEALIDVVHRADGTVQRMPGGSPSNVAVGLARLGISTQLLCCLGSDDLGDDLRAHLREEGVELRPAAAPVPARTSTADAFVGPDGATEYRFTVYWDPGPFISGAVRVLHVGSMAALIEPGATDVMAALAAAQSGTVVTFDPNVRPSLGFSPAAVRERIEQVARFAHLVKMSDEDLAWMYPDRSLEQVAARLLAFGVRLLVVTRGERGCVMAAQEWVHEVPALRVPVVDTIGAGDSFMSGMIAAILDTRGDEALHSEELEQDLCATWAMTGLRSAAITVSRAGAQPPTADELERAVDLDPSAGAF